MKSINYNAPVQCSQSVTINAPAQKVWQVLTGINNWSQWQTDISKPKLKGNLMPGTAFSWKTGGALIHSVLHTVTPFQHFGWTGKTFGMYAIHNWTLSEQNGSTTVLADESMEGLIAWLFKKSFNKNLETGMHHWLKLLNQECEKQNTQ